LLIEWDSNGRKPYVWGRTLTEIWCPEMPFPAFWASKFALTFISANYTCNWNIKKEGKTHKKQKIKPKTYFPFIYLLFFACLFV
jgi:hypothetical protein